jgi:signal transduction histidine kinase
MREQLGRVCIVAAVCLVLWLVLDTLVSGRVGAIVEQLSGAASGGAVQPALSGSDELAQISRSAAAAMTQVRETEARLLEAAERERRRIGSDLHDDVCQRIVAAQLKSGVLGSVLRSAGHEQAGLATEVADELAKAASVARGFARGLAPMLVQRGRLAETLRELAGALSDSFMIRCTADCDLGDQPLALWADTHVFRIAQELAVNAAKHARPSWIRIDATAREGRLVVQVESDGAAPGDARGGGIGLEMIRQRARALGGKFHLQAGPGGQGSVARCEAPLGPRHFADPVVPGGSPQQR